MGCIYKITNLVNGKVYVGLTVNTAKHRFNKHLNSMRRGVSTALYSAMKKYGVENFQLETVIEEECRERLMTLEVHYIKKFGSLSPNGYNLTTGGENCKVTPETKRKMSEKMSGRKVTWGDKVSKGVKRVWENEEYRAKQTEQRKQKRGKYREGIKKPLRLNLPNDKIREMYRKGESINAIADKYNVAFCTIKRRVMDES